MCQHEFLEQIYPTNKEFPPGKYPMWWSCDDDKVFSNSKVRVLITKAYTSAEWVEEVVLALLLQQLNLVSQSKMRVGLPAKLHSWHAQYGDDIITISSSEEKGIRLHFDPANTPSARVEYIWNDYANFVTSVNASFPAKKSWLDLIKRTKHTSAFTWWTNILDITQVLDAKNEDTKEIGALVFK
jgi:hypothetical protein